MTDRLRLLCVDDEEHILNTLQRFCRNESIEVLTATSACEALDILKQEPVSIVLSDYQMPGMNGLAFLEEVRQRWPHTVRIILSGFVTLPVINQAQQRGDIFAFIAKPWSREELKGLLAKAYEQYRDFANGKTSDHVS